jgi:hypothetical protein
MGTTKGGIVVAVESGTGVVADMRGKGLRGKVRVSMEEQGSLVARRLHLGTRSLKCIFLQAPPDPCLPTRDDVGALATAD